MVAGVGDLDGVHLVGRHSRIGSRVDADGVGVEVTLRSFLCAFWCPPSACDLRNFLLQKRQGKSLTPLPLPTEATGGEEDKDGGGMWASVSDRSTASSPTAEGGGAAIV